MSRPPKPEEETAGEVNKKGGRGRGLYSYNRT